MSKHEDTFYASDQDSPAFGILIIFIMDKNKNNFKSIIPDFAIIIILIILGSFFLSHHMFDVFPDRGREWLIPQAILEGAVPYKNITLIYFPLAYYINAFIYLIGGISINSLMYSQTILAVIYMLGYYLLSREFISRKVSLLLTILIITCSIFSISSLFGFIEPYSYSRTYGIFGFFFCVFSLVRLHRTDNIKYLYAASVFAGFSACCKLEFLSIYLILATGIFLYKKLKTSQYLKCILLSLLFPIITLSILFYQGVSFNDLYNAALYGFKFSKTSSMITFLSEQGMYPLNIDGKLHSITFNESFFVMIVILCLAAIKLQEKFKFNLIIPLCIVFLWNYYYNDYSIYRFWLILPITIFIWFCIKFKYLLINDKSAFLVILSAIFISQREFFHLVISVYGSYSFPLLILSLIILLKTQKDGFITHVNTDKFLCTILVTLIGFYSFFLYKTYKQTPYIVASDKGSIYTNSEKSIILNKTNYYIKNKIPKDSTILVLPEGNILNFFNDRKVDMRCFIMDRLYHDAYGEKEALEKIKQTNSDYIILIRGLKYNNFYKEYLYDSDATLAGEYVDKNYEDVREYTSENLNLIIKKKK